MKKTMVLLLVLAGCSTSVPMKPEEVLTLPGVVANRSTKTVTIKADATGVVQGDFIEFLLITSGSGHDYEAFAISQASGGDIRKAMEFIGMKPGRGIDRAGLRFWPKGERVIITVRVLEGESKPMRLERYFLDDRTGKGLPEEGFVFTGSRYFTPEGSNATVLAVDSREPGAIISDYNEPDALFDVPWLSPQDETYSHIAVDPAKLLAKKTPLELVLEPEFKDGRLRVMDVMLRIDAAAGVGADSISTTLKEGDGKVVLDKKPLKDALITLQKAVKDGRDVFVTLSLADGLTLETAEGISQIIREIESPDGIRLEPPEEGQLYYRAYSPSGDMLNREDRAMHPWELRLKAGGGKGLTGVLSFCETQWAEDGSMPTFTVSDHAVADGDALKATIDSLNKKRKEAEKDSVIPVILVVGEPKMTVGQVLQFLKPVMKDIKTIHVFSREPGKNNAGE